MENIKKHIIQKDDTIKSIAEKYQLEIDELLSFHNSKVGITQQLFGEPIPFHIGEVYISFDDVQ